MTSVAGDRSCVSEGAGVGYEGGLTTDGSFEEDWNSPGANSNRVSVRKSSCCWEKNASRDGCCDVNAPKSEVSVEKGLDNDMSLWSANVGSVAYPSAISVNGYSNFGAVNN
jgi:hypothetical protein